MRELSAFQWLSDSRDQNRIKVTMGVVRWSKEAFQMNQFSISAFPRCFSCVCVTEFLQGAYRRCISQSVLSTAKHESVQAFWWVTLLHLAVSSGRAKGPPCWTSPRERCISLSGISSTSFTPSSRRLPRWLRCIPLLTSPPLMPFSLDHYPPLASALLAIAQSETPASPRSPLCGHCSREVRRLWSGSVWLFTLIWSMGSACCSELLANLGCR